MRSRAFLRLFVNLIIISFANRYNQYADFCVDDLVNETVATRPKVKFVVFIKA